MPDRIELEQFSAHVRKLKQKEFVDTFLGAMMTSQGMLLVLFSTRLNKEFALIVSGTETSRIIKQLDEIL